MKTGFYWRLAVTNIKNHRRIYIPYLLSSIGIAMMFYILSALGPSIREDEMYGGTTVGTMMELGSYVIGLFAVLFLFYTNSFLMKRRKKELGLYNILGMEKFHIAKMIFRETLIVAASTILLGLGFGILFSKLMFLALGKVLDVAIPIAFVVPGEAVLYTAVLFLCIFFATMLWNILQVRLTKPIELLHGGEIGEKEPKAHWLLALLGVLLLGGGYYLAVVINDPFSALMWFFVAVILVIVGTYLLFVTGITALLKLLKKNKDFYYKANHFTALSGMLYRMKQNAAGLASICILFTCLLVTVSTTFSLYTGMEDIIRERYPRNVMIQSLGANEKAEAMIREITADECEKAGIAPENVLERTSLGSFVASRQDNAFMLGNDVFSSTYSVLQFFVLGEFNSFSSRQETLAADEVFLCDPRGTFPGGDTILLNGESFRVRKTDFDLSDGDSAAMIYETYFLVFPDEETVRRVLDASPDSAKEVMIPHYYYGFDISGDRELVSQVVKAIEQRFGTDFSTEDASFKSLLVEDMSSGYESYLSLYGGLFFLGMFLGILFLLGTALIIYYKQVSEGYEDTRRFGIMQQVGMSRREVKQSIHSQIILVFFLPLLTAVLHLGFAFPMLRQILIMLNMTDFWRIFASCAGCVLVFGLVYAAIYAVTARTYYKIVETASAE